MATKPVDTAIVMVVGPCIDDTDFKTLEEAIAYDAAGMDISLIIEKTDGTTAVTAITLTTGGTSDWTHTDGGYYEVEITAAQNAEEGVGYLRGVCTGVLPFESPRYDIQSANVYDSLTKGTDKLQVDAVEISGDAGAADNAELDYDGTGYAKVNSTIGTCTANTDMRGTDSAALASNYTAARAGYLDNISEGSVALASDVAVDIVLETGIAHVDSQTEFYLDTGSGSNDAYNGMSVIIYDTSDNKNGCRRKIISYGTALKNITIDSAPDFTVVDTDTVKVFESPDMALMALASVCTETRLAELDAANLPTDIADIPTVAEFEARTIVTADYPTETEMTSAFTEIKGATWAAGSDTLEHIRNKQTDIETDTAEIGTAGAGLTDLGGMSTGMKGEVNAEADTALTDYDPPTNTEMEARTLLSADYVVVGDTIAGVTTATNLTNAPTSGDLTATMKTSVNTEAKDVLTVDPIADSYATDGNQPTIAQAILAIQQMMQDKSISGTTLTVKKPDGSTTAMTFTLDSATTPTSITRAT